jgi:hypothetical protein
VFRPLGLFGISPILRPVNAANLQRLFLGKSIFSYLGMPQYLRSIVGSLSTSAQALITKTTHTFSLTDTEYFNNYMDTDFFDDLANEDEFVIASTGSIVAQCKVMDDTQALKTLTNSSVYHDGEDGQNEYRSLTELNSVVNIVPLQMIGATFQKHYLSNGLDVPEGGFGFTIGSYAIFDFVINVSDVPPDSSPGTVTIAGEVTIKGLITNTTAMQFNQVTQALPEPISNILDPGWAPNEEDGSLVDNTYGGFETVNKSAQIQISSRNNVSWDKEWLDGSSVNLDSNFSDSQNLHRDSSQDLTQLDTTPLVIPFNQTVTLDRGDTAIRLRAIGKVEHLLTNDLLADLWVNEPDWIDPQTCHEHFILNPDGPGFILDFHCHFNLGVTSNNFINNPMTMAEDLQEGSIALSMTVNGTRLNPISYDISN